MRNKIADLNNHLFAQLERLNDEDLKGSELRTEIDRANAVACVAAQIVNSAKVTVAAVRALKGTVGQEDLPLLFYDQKQIGHE